MGKKNKRSANLGRSLIKDRFGNSSGRKFVGDDSMLHTTEIQDGYDWGRLNLQSVTEESSFQEFLSTAELAGTEFQAEKLNIKFVNPRSNVGLLSQKEKADALLEFERNKELIRIPRRPAWDSHTTPEDLTQKERDTFLEWRRALATLQEDKGVLLTPFEKNLEFWRQLWRVVERSDVVIQIVDARNPMLFRCEDLEKYVKEVSQEKSNLILLNKADFLTPQQRKLWADYFSELKVHVAFFSATNTQEAAEPEESTIDLSVDDIKEEVDKLDRAVNKVAEVLATVLKSVEHIVEEYAYCKEDEGDSSRRIELEFRNSSELLTREELIEFLKGFHKGLKVTPGITTIGLVGYPNVGKSSTINALMTVKKVSVSATPGKTKHFQTLYLEKDVLLCDCPGLVMPSFVFTKADMIVNGVLPIDQMRDHVPPVNLVCSLIPRRVFEDKYGIMLPSPMEGEDEMRCPTAEELLNSYAYNRGFMTANGQPDNPRAARYVLKDFINGKLLYAHAPPGLEQNDYHAWPGAVKVHSDRYVGTPGQIRAIRPNRTTGADIDEAFFKSLGHNVHTKGSMGKLTLLTNREANLNSENKPWKKLHKHENKKKKEKLRRLYAHLDQH